MDQKRIVLTTVLLLILGQAVLFAQCKLFIKNKSGTQINFELNSIQKLTFSTDKLTLHQDQLGINSYELSNISYLSFVNYTTEIQPINSHEKSNYLLYPNPVIDQLEIIYELTKPGNVILEITDLLGSIKYRQNISSLMNINHVTISVEQLHAGLYICRIRNDARLEIIKFFKN